jgi:hypothetical protein
MNFGNVQVDSVNNKIMSSIDNSIVFFDIIQEKVLNLPTNISTCGNDMISWIKCDSSSQSAYFCDESGGVASFDYKGRNNIGMELSWWRESHEAMPYSIDFDKDYTDLYIYSGGFDRKLKVTLPRKNKVARSIDLDKVITKASDKYMKM